MGNPNTELLTWAVENITGWNDDYTHLRSDASRHPFYTRGGVYGWSPDRGCKLAWASDDNNGFSSVYKELAKDFSTTTLQVITKQEWQAAKASSNALKTACKPQQGHIHAELMAEYAIVAKTNPEPWKEFEMQYVATGDWLFMGCADSFLANYKYRRKPSPPKTMKIGDIVVEACPLKEAPEKGGYCHRVKVNTCGFEVASSTWDDYDFERSRLQNGYIFATQQEAQAVADALNSIYKKAVDEAWKS